MQMSSFLEELTTQVGHADYRLLHLCLLLVGSSDAELLTSMKLPIFLRAMTQIMALSSHCSPIGEFQEKDQ